MGWMTIKGIGLWGDETQDLVDSYLLSYGFDSDKRYTKKQLISFYNKAAKDKHLADAFNLVLAENVLTKPTRKEFLYHIRFGLGMLKVSHPFDDKVKRG